MSKPASAHPRVFVSYVREDAVRVALLAQALERAGVEVWYDKTSLQPGQFWQLEIRNAISRGDYFLACFSAEQAAREASYMNEELTLAIEQLRRRPDNRAWFIPVLLDPVEVPDRTIGAGQSLRDIHAANLSTDWDAGIAAILRVLGAATPRPRMDRIVGPPAQRGGNRRARALFVRRILAAIVAAVAIALWAAFGHAALPPHTARTQVGELCGGLPARDADFLRDLLPPRSNVQLLVASGSTIPAGDWARYREMATLIAQCVGDGTTLTLRPIGDRDIIDLPLFRETAPNVTNYTNDLRFRLDSEAFANRAATAIDRLPAFGKGSATADPLGALSAAGQGLKLDKPGSKNVVIMIFNGWQQTRGLNLFQYNRDPAISIAPSIRKLRAGGMLPDLTGSEVAIFGLSRGDARMQTKTAQMVGLCRFWSAVVKASGGSIKICTQTLPGLVRDVSASQ